MNNVNVLQYSAAIGQAFKNYFDSLGSPYKPFTTFASDLAIGEIEGTKGVTDTITRCWNSWKSDYKYLTELIMAINFMAWMHDAVRKKNPSKLEDSLVELYSKSYYDLTDRFYEEYDKDDAAKEYFFEQTD